MPCILKIRVLAGRDLPVMDKASDLTDAYVEVRFADFDVQRTAVCRKTLNPIWNADFRFEVSDDADLQNEPLELKVLDYDAISANDAVGSVLVDLNPLLSWDAVEGVVQAPGPAVIPLESATAENASTQQQQPVPPSSSSQSQQQVLPMLAQASSVAGSANVLPSVLTSNQGPLSPQLFLSQSQQTTANAAKERQISGWFPIYDTLRGIRGEIHIQVKLQFFGDVNPFKESSAGVQVFGSGCLPVGYQVEEVYGFVEVLLTEDDPEYHWSDSFRTPRYSNEARQKLLYKMSGQLRRLLGKEVLEMGGNAVLGLRQFFDLEKEECMITARAIGTCVRLSSAETVRPTDALNRSGSIRSLSRLAAERLNLSGTETSVLDEIQETANEKLSKMQKDALNETKSVNSPAMSTPSTVMDQRKRFSIATRRRDLVHQKTLSSMPSEVIPESKAEMEQDAEMSDVVSMSGRLSNAGYKFPSKINYRQSLEPQLVTLSEFPKNFISNISGIVSARSVKLLQSDETEVRENWWNELRDEIKSHAKTLGCSTVLGYTETAIIRDELCILSAIGTAAVVDFDSLDREEPNTEAGRDVTIPVGDVIDDTVESLATGLDTSMNRRLSRKQYLDCRCCHIPYSRSTAPFPMNFIRCQKCKRKYVPEILLCNIEPPVELQTVGEGYYVEAHVCRPKKRKDGESNATIIGEILPFIEYDIHRQLLYKLRIQGLNAIFGLQIQLAIGESLIIAVASGTATFLAALPPPPPLIINRNLDVLDAEDRQFMDMQRRIMELSEENRRRIESARLKLAQSDLSLASVDEFGETNVISTAVQSATNIGDDSPDVTGIVSDVASPPLSVPASKPSLSGAVPEIFGSSPSLNPQSSPRGTGKSLWTRQLASGDHSDSDLSSVDSGGDEYPLSAAPMNVVVQVDDETDEDLMAVLLDPQYPEVFQICNTQTLPIQETITTPMAQISKIVRSESKNLAVNSVLESSRSKSANADMANSASTANDIKNNLYNAQMITLLKKGTLSATARHPNRQLAALFHEMYEELQVSLGYFQSCLITGISYQLDLPKDNEIQIRLNATVIGQYSSPNTIVTGLPNTVATDEPTVFSFDGPLVSGLSKNAMKNSQVSIQESLQRIETFVNQSMSPLSSMDYPFSFASHATIKYVEITPLSRVPGHQVVKHLGRLSLHFVKEDLHLHYAASEYTYYFFSDPNATEDGLGRFMHRFLSEVQAIARAHTVAMGGNALIAFRLEQTIIRETLKNQAYGMLSISGDVVQVKPVVELKDQLVNGEQLAEYLWQEAPLK